MRILLGYVLPLVGLAAISASPQHGVSQLNDAFLAALKSGDLEAIMKMYAPEAVLYPPGEREQRGLEPIRFKWERLLLKNRVREASLSAATYRTAGNLSVGWGQVSMSLEPRDGSESVKVEGRFTAIAEKKAGRWLYLALLLADLREPLTLQKYGARPTPRRPR